MNKSSSKLSPLAIFVLVVVLGIGGYKLLTSGNTPVSQPQAGTASRPVLETPQAKPPGSFRLVSSDAVALEGKPYVLYVGAQFCPFCAAERWSIVKALENFGTWIGLSADMSADEEAGFSRLPTYNFVGATYESQYVSFAHKELADREGRPIPGQELSAFEEQWFNKYNPRGGVPFLFINGKYVQLAYGYSPQLLAGKTFEEVKREVDSNADTPLVAAIQQEANVITAYICKSTNNQPSDVCTRPEIAALVSQIP